MVRVSRFPGVAAHLCVQGKAYARSRTEEAEACVYLLSDEQETGRASRRHLQLRQRRTGVQRAAESYPVR